MSSSSEPSSQNRLRLAGLFVWIITVLLLVVILLSWLFLPKNTAGQFPRRIEHNVVVIGQTFPVVIESEILPVCPVQPVDLILVLDASSSMETTKTLLQTTLDGMLGNIEFDHTRVGLVFSQASSDQSSLILPLSQDVSQVKAFIGDYQTGGGTEDDLGMQQALSLLETSPENRAKMIVLLSDGGTKNPDDLRQSVRAMQQEYPNANLVMLGFQTGENLLLLQEIAETTALHYFYAADSSSELQAFYSELPTLVKQFSQTVSVNYEEPINEDAFEIVDNSPMLDGAMLQVLGEPSPVISYTLRSNALGWHSITDREGYMTFTDCDGETTTIARESGPVILTVFPWLFWIIPVLLGSLLLFGGWWRKNDKKKSSQPVTKPELPIQPVALPPTQTETPFWLTNVKAVTLGTAENNQPIHPTFFIGIGPTSLPVLERIAHNLSEVKSNNQINNVNFLQIDVIPEGYGQNKSSSTTIKSEQVVLKPNLTQYTDRLHDDPDTNYNLDWWRVNRPGEVSQDFDRAAARLGLFDDLQTGITNSDLWAKLGQGISQLNTSVWIIASASDWVGSSLAFDVAHLVRQTGGSGASVAGVSLVLMLQKVDASDFNGQVSGYESAEWRSARTFASFQELARFSRNQSVRFRYNPMAVNQPILDSASASVRLVDDVYVVNAGFELSKADLPEPRADIKDEVSAKATSPQVIGALADTLTTILSTPVRAAVQNSTNSIRTEVASNNQIRGDETYVMSMSCASYRVPFVDLREYAGVRLAYELLINASEPVYGLLAETNGKLPDMATAVSSWLRGDGDLATQHPLWSQVADLSENAPVLNPVMTTQNATTWFKVKLLEKVTAVLNGEDHDLATNGGQLNIALRFCRELNGRLRKTVSRVSPGSRLAVNECQKWTNSLMQDLDQWDRNLNPQIRELSQDVKRIQKKLEKELQAPYHWTPESARNIESFYWLQVRSEGKPGKDMLEIGRKRIGWMPSSGLEPSLRLGVVALTQPHDQTQWYSTQDAATFKDAVLSLSHRLAQQIVQPTPADLLADSAYRQRVSDWLVANSGEGRTGGMVSTGTESNVLEQQLFILSQGIVGDQKLSQLIADSVHVGAAEPIPLEGLQPGSCSLVRIVGPIALHSIDAYKQAEKAFRQAPRPELLMAFDIEQLQVACRKRLGRTGRFSPPLCNALADIPLARLFVALATVGLIYIEGESKQILLTTPNDKRPIHLSEEENWLEALAAFANASPLELNRKLRAESRVQFVQQLQQAIRTTENNNFAAAQQARLHFEQMTDLLLSQPEGSNLWQLGIVFEYLLGQR